MLKYMLDTNICIFTITNKPEKKVRAEFKRHHGQMCISSITLMELIYGAEKPGNPERNLAIVAAIAARLDEVDYDRKLPHILDGFVPNLRATVNRLGRIIK